MEYPGWKAAVAAFVFGLYPGDRMWVRALRIAQVMTNLIMLTSPEERHGRSGAVVIGGAVPLLQGKVRMNRW
jgi:hypothetical protein